MTVNEVNKTSLGFFTEAGRLRSKAELTSSETAKAPVKTGPSEASSDAVVSDSFRPVGARVAEQASKAQAKLTSRDHDLRKASSIARQEIDATRELKYALASADAAGIVRAKEELERVAQKRESFRSEIEQRNQERQADGSSFIRVGNREVLKVADKAVMVAPRNTSPLATTDDAERRLKDLQAERQGYVEERQAIKRLEKDLHAATASAFDQIQHASTDSASLRDIASAQELTGQVTQQISGLTKDQLISGVHAGLGRDSVQVQVIQSLIGA